ncbi:zinc finger CCCH domain-containing protein 5 [Diospyros lotus]|uniref:zinc finger CCCH domain-containing protein 5 n=1 Tax=Diospyros lotus TaxID=55363 RepID=UPI00224D6A8E|nr:zinc finger CCCH domain-containing protein 5 [Diospyros lotus]XP_052206107.1 zinc finger CCCH domain-containing protein 5 [Diospyros lotus]
MAQEVGGGADVASGAGNDPASRNERRKAAKKEKRKQKRKELAAKEREEEEARLNDPEEWLRIQLEEERDRERMERDRKEFEEHEKAFLEALEANKKAEEEEEERRKALEEEYQRNQVGHEDANGDDDWEYVEEGPPEIIWQGNEIIVKKKKVKVKRKDADLLIKIEDPNRPTSNPLPPQSEAFTDYKNGFVTSAEQLLENVAQQVPNFGTEQDKAHCPFHLKTGACRFGMRCSRVHFYPHNSCTLLMKNMYNGPGLACEQDEGLEYTDEEVERSYEEFYEDVHTEFLKYGEIVNFKVCKNSSVHLRGNVYVHYKSMDSALLAYQSINGRYFAGKQVNCEFVSVTKWKVAICGEYMKSRLKTCSRGTACNFIHCFRNPGGDYEWADWDKPPPKYWAKKMAVLFGYREELDYDDQKEQGRNFGKMIATDPDRYDSRRSQSREWDSSRSHYEEYGARRSRHRASVSRRSMDVLDENYFGEGMNSRHKCKKKHRWNDFDSDGVPDDYDKDRTHSTDYGCDNNRDRDRDRDKDSYHKRRKNNAQDQNEVPSSPDNVRDKGNTAQDSDSREKNRDRGHKHRRKGSSHSNERLGPIDGHGKSVKSSKNEQYPRKSDSNRVEPQKVKKLRRSNRGDLTDLEPSEATFSANDLRSDRSHHETSSSSPHYERIESCDIDPTCESDESTDGYRSSTKHHKSWRETCSDEIDESDRARRRSESHDSDENVDKRGRWESDKSLS